MWRASCSPSHLLHRLRSIVSMPSSREGALPRRTDNDHDSVRGSTAAPAIYRQATTTAPAMRTALLSRRDASEPRWGVLPQPLPPPAELCLTSGLSL